MRGNCHCRCAHCHLAISADGSRKEKGSRIKGTNYIPPQTFGLMSKWGSVVILALSPQPPCFSLSRATCSRASPRCDPACTDSSRGTANPFICCCSSYLPHGDGWEEPAPLRPAQDPLGQAGISQPNPWSVHKHKKTGDRERERSEKWGAGLQKTSHPKKARQI